MNTLKETVIGVIIIKVHGEGALKRRIMEWYTKRYENLCSQGSTAWRSDRDYQVGMSWLSSKQTQDDRG